MHSWFLFFHKNIFSHCGLVYGVKYNVEAGVFLRGITAEERLLISRRYALARDVKILALGAEILNQAKHPIAIISENNLRHYAKEKGWPIFNFNDDVYKEIKTLLSDEVNDNI